MFILAGAFVLGLALATYTLGNLTSALGLAFLAIIAVVGLVIAAAGDDRSFQDDI